LKYDKASKIQTGWKMTKSPFILAFEGGKKETIDNLVDSFQNGGIEVTSVSSTDSGHLISGQIDLIYFWDYVKGKPRKVGQSGLQTGSVVVK
jgi:hypothetical protein